jgi:hypothetical protein
MPQEMDPTEADIRRLRLALAETRKTSAHYSGELRADLIRIASAMRANGHTWTTIAKSLGVGMETPRRLCDGMKRGLTVESSGSFVPVNVRSSANNASSFAVVSPSGFRVECLDVETAVQLLRRLG